VVVKEHEASGSTVLSDTKTLSHGTYAVVRFTAQATITEITNFLGAYKATVVEGPMKNMPMHYLVKLSDEELPADEFSRIIREMQEESKIVALIARKP